MSALGGFLGGFGGSTIGASVVSLILQTKQFDAGLVQARGRLTTATAQMEGSTSRFAGLAKAGYAAAAVAAVAFAVKAVDAASDEEEALNKTNVVFGRSSEAVTRFAETSAKSFGISRAAALEAAAGFGQMLITSGLSADAAANMSMKLVQLAADLASFNNIDPAEALEKLRSGLAGEAEPLRQLGILLSENRVKTEAYGSGIAKTGAELTEAQKVQARYNLILQDSGKAQGDFARTSGSMANQQRILMAQVQDLAAEVGRSLIPVLKILLTVVTAVLGPFADLVNLLFNTESAADGARRELEALGYSAREAAEAVAGVDEASQRSGVALVSQRFQVVATTNRLRAFTETAARNAEVAEGWAKRQQAVAASAREAGRAVHRFAGLSEKALADLRRSVKEDFAAAVESISGFQKKWTFTAASFPRQVDQMREKSKTLADDLDRFSKLKGVPEAFQAWLLQQGPDAVHAFVRNNRAGRDAIVADWRAIEGNVRSNKRALDAVTETIVGVKRAIDDIPNKKTIDITVRYHQVGTPPPGIDLSDFDIDQRANV